MKVYLSPGHGQDDPGAIAAGLCERDLNKAIVDQVAGVLRLSGIEAIVGVARPDSHEGIVVDCTEANNSGADLAVQIHLNAFDDPSANGTETWICGTGGNAEVMAQAIDSALAALGFADRGVKVGNYTFNLVTTMSSCLVEVGFITNDSDRAKITQNMVGVSRAIAQGIARTLGTEIVTPAPALPPPAVIVPTGGPLYIVFKNGVQFGAYRVLDNALRQVKDGLLKGVPVRVDIKR